MQTGKKINTVGKWRSIIAFLWIMAFSSLAFAQEKTPVRTAPSELSSPALYIMLAVIIVLLVGILAMGESIKAAAKYRSEKNKEGNLLKTILVLVMAGAATLPASAQEKTATLVETPAQQVTDYWGLSPSTFYAFCAIILFELVVFFILRNISMQLLYEKKEQQAVKKAVVKPRLMERLNASVAVEKEETIMLDHEYDGIRELDNNLPPWWKYGFYISILFSVIYLVHYHVLATGQLQIAEYESEIKKANEELEEYRKKATNLVDENNVTLLTDAASINEGKSLYLGNCAACHGKSGEGGVGPNLTDDYWLHEGGIKDIFRSIKYGWSEKGMKAWEQDFSPRQIHQIASFVKSLHGTHPANAKEKQGELYQETGTALSDSTKTDSTEIRVAGK